MKGDREYRHGPHCRWPFGIGGHFSFGSSVPPCSGRFDAWYHRGDEWCKSSVGFRAWFIFGNLSWGK